MQKRQFTENDEFFLIESFTIFMEKFISNQSDNQLKQFWLDFKRILHDKSKTPTEVFSYVSQLNLNSQLKSPKPESSTSQNTLNTLTTPIKDKFTTPQPVYRSPKISEVEKKDFPTIYQFPTLQQTTSYQQTISPSQQPSLQQQQVQPSQLVQQQFQLPSQQQLHTQQPSQLSSAANKPPIFQQISSQQPTVNQIQPLQTVDTISQKSYMPEQKPIQLQQQQQQLQPTMLLNNTIEEAVRQPQPNKEFPQLQNKRVEMIRQEVKRQNSRVLGRKNTRKLSLEKDKKINLNEEGTEQITLQQLERGPDARGFLARINKIQQSPKNNNQFPKIANFHNELDSSSDEEKLKHRVAGKDIGKLFALDNNKPAIQEMPNPYSNLLALVQEGITKFNQNTLTLDLVCTKSTQGQTTIHKEEKRSPRFNLPEEGNTNTLQQQPLQQYAQQPEKPQMQKMMKQYSIFSKQPLYTNPNSQQQKEENVKILQQAVDKIEQQQQYTLSKKVWI